MQTLVPPLRDAAALPQPYLLFLGDIVEPGYAKTAFGLRDWAPERCVGEFACAGAAVSTGLPSMTPGQARALGARAMVIGGMHVRLASIDAVRDAAVLHGRRLIDVREPPAGLPVATGHKRTGRRLLTIGTDCAQGKKYTALSLARAFTARGLDATFRATGQTGILIAGAGVPMDAVVSDFAAGAAESLSPDADPAHWDVIEGQGSLAHPAYAGVSLSLLHGSQPDVIVVCHAHGRERMLGHAHFALPSIEDTIALALQLGARTNPAIRCAGISLNTGALDDADAHRVIEETAARTGLPVGDPIRGGESFKRLVDACLA